MYAEAAVDGSKATIWAQLDTIGSLTVDLRQKMTITAVRPVWTDTLPSSSRILVSSDGKTWTVVSPAADGTLATPVTARYVRVELTRAVGAARTGLRELGVYSG